MMDRTGTSKPEGGNNDIKPGQKENDEISSATNRNSENVLWVCDKCTFQSKSENVIKEDKSVDHTGTKRTTISTIQVLNEGTLLLQVL